MADRSIPRRETLRGTQWHAQSRCSVWNSRRGPHLGQRSSATASTGRTYDRKRSDPHAAHLLQVGGTASAPGCQAWSIAGAAPLQELFEQPVALVLRQASGRDIARRQELFELVAPSMAVLIARLLEPFVGALEPLPARQHGRQDRVVPLFMSWRLPEFVQAREEGFDKLVEAPIVIAVLRPVVGDHDCAARHRLDA